MREQGIVTAVEKKVASVRIDKKSECEKCGMCLFPQGATNTELKVQNNLNAQVGDKVTIETVKDAKFLGALLVFLIPLVLIAIAVVLGVVVLQNELYVLLISVVLIAIWFSILAVIDKKLKKSKGFIPIIVSIDEQKL